MDPVARAELIDERCADRFDHLRDPETPVSTVAVRASRSAIADVGHRILGGEVSVIPTALMFFMIGLGAFWQTLTADFPPQTRLSDAILGVGLVAAAIAGMVSPRALHRRWLLPGMLMAAVGTIGGALTIPVVSETAVFDWANKAALALVAIGFLVVVYALLPSPANRTWLIRGGAIVWFAALANGVAQLGWAVVDSGVHTSRGAAVLVFIGCAAGAAVLGRLRGMPVVG